MNQKMTVRRRILTGCQALAGLLLMAYFLAQLL